MCNEYESKNRERIKMKKEIEKWQREMEEKRRPSLERILTALEKLQKKHFTSNSQKTKKGI